VKDLEGAVLRAGVEDVPGLVEVDLDDGVGVAEVEESASLKLKMEGTK